MEVALIVAGGSGTRMQSSYPKQFLNLGGKPILMHTIESFYNYSKSISILLVLPGVWFEEWHKLIKQNQFIIDHKLVEGGISRTQSVSNGLQHVNEEDLVAIHDGVRPFASEEVISDAFLTASRFGNAIVCVKPKESIREILKDGSSKAVNRDDFRIIQTPQVFAGSIIKSAYKQAVGIQKEFTDDASLAEYVGQKIHLIDGDYTNIKITTPEDMVTAESILKSRRESKKPGY